MHPALYRSVLDINCHTMFFGSKKDELFGNFKRSVRGSIRKEIDFNAFKMIRLSNCRAEVEDARSPCAQAWRIAPGAYAKYNDVPDKTRPAMNNHRSIQRRVQFLLDYYVLENRACQGGHT